MTLPVVIILLVGICSKDVCLELPLGNAAAAKASLLSALGSVVDSFSWTAVAVVLGWIGFHAALERLLPGEAADGVVLADGTRLKYRMNAHLAFWVSLLMLTHGCPQADGDTIYGSWDHAHRMLARPEFGACDLAWIYDSYVELAVASILVATALAVYLYASSFGAGRALAAGGVSVAMGGRVIK